MSQRSETTALGLTFKNPVIVASCDIARDPACFEAFAASGVGGIITKSVTDAPELQESSIARFHIADMSQRPVQGAFPNSYYFFSRGGSMMSMDALAAEAPELLAIGRRYGTVVIGSISASHPDHWVSYAKQMEALGFAALELNFGNPHGEAAKGKLGYLIGQSPDLCRQIAQAVVQAVKIPVIVKLTPQVSDLTALALALQEVGVRAVTVMHRFQGLMIDPETDSPILGGCAAIGGPWMKPISLANVSKIYQKTQLTILGGNGADTARDVYDFLLSGAHLVEICSTMMLRGPAYARQLVQELEELLEQKGKDVASVVGRTAESMVSYKNLGALPRRHSQLDGAVCTGCKEKTCLQSCYFGGLRLENGQVVQDTDHCSGCGLCVHSCPHGAVKMVMGGTKHEND